ncbi:MAG: phosphatidate cytidylyltransferase [Treponema sp.]|nr:phosphatidate cytidylyltransferase [Treponema sp.]
MNKSNLIKRLLTFFIGVPAILFIALLNFHAHLPLHIFICFMCGIGASELYTMFSGKTPLHKRGFVIFLAVAIPFAAALFAVFPTFSGGKNLPGITGPEFITYTFIVAILLVLAAEVFTARTFEHSLVRIASVSFIVLYTGYLLTFLSRMSFLKNKGMDISSQTISVFLLMVFLCDSLAWFFGILLGKNNRGIIKASPNKSIVGFIGGIVGSVIAGLIGYHFCPELFEGPLYKVIILSVCTALAAIVGDLAESVFKRSAGIKDSGRVVPGRGGVLDTIDSILMSAPVYYFLIILFYAPK